MQEYKGAKFRCIGSHMGYKQDEWGRVYKTEINDFVPTRGYLKYLEDKRQKAREDYLMVLRSKLEYQYKTYGEVDDIDLQEYLYKVKLWG